MSFRVLVIPEDPTLNGYILRPLISAILADAGKPRARVQVLTNPRLGGYDHAVAALRGDLVDRYQHWDLWLFMPDADRMSPDKARGLERELRARGVTLLCCPAVPELEIYPCVAYRSELGETWTEVREHFRFKEQYFEPLLSKYGDARAAGEGREAMMNASLNPIQTLYLLCPELKLLREQLAELLHQG